MPLLLVALLSSPGALTEKSITQLGFLPRAFDVLSDGNEICRRPVSLEKGE